MRGYRPRGHPAKEKLLQVVATLEYKFALPPVNRCITTTQKNTMNVGSNIHGVFQLNAILLNQIALETALQRSIYSRYSKNSTCAILFANDQLPFFGLGCNGAWRIIG